MKPRVLIIDDDADVRLILEVRLHRAGFDVATAAEGGSGLALLDQHRPDIVLVDLVMPGMSGFDFLTQLDKRADAPPALAMTCNEDDPESHGQLAGRLGAEALITKTEVLERDFPDFLIETLTTGSHRSASEASRDVKPALAA